MARSLTSHLAVAALFVALPFAAHAAGSDDTSTDAPSCPSGQVYNESSQQCVDQQAGVLPDAGLTDNAFALADEGRFDEARDVLALRAGGHDAMSLTALGYITRKEGDARTSITYYMQAIAMDATDTRVRQYLGEAYVQLGWMDDARRQLTTIAQIAGVGSRDYLSLAAVIEAAS